MTTSPAINLTNEQLREALELVKDADSVELKLTIPEMEQRSAVTALGMDPLDAQIRQVYFFDTPDLALNERGVVVRARRVQRRGDDSVVKLRPVVPHELPSRLRKSPNFVVEVDAMPGGFVCSASLKGETTDVIDVAHGDRSIRKLFSKEQRAFYEDHAPAGLSLDDLAILGPITVLKLKFTLPELEQDLVAELWTYPDYSRILELSTKSRPGEALQTAIRAKLLLLERGVDVTGEQHTKTKTALEYFSRTARQGG